MKSFIDDLASAGGQRRFRARPDINLCEPLDSRFGQFFCFSSLLLLAVQTKVAHPLQVKLDRARSQVTLLPEANDLTLSYIPIQGC